MRQEQNPIQDSAELTDKVLDFVLLMQDYIRKIRGNVNLQLIQQNLYFQLNKLFRPEAMAENKLIKNISVCPLLY